MIRVSLDDWYDLGKTAFGEARGEPLQGIIAVCWTVINRVMAHAWYGSTIEEVVLKPLQYSCWNGSDLNRPRLLLIQPTDPDYRRCLGVAALVLSGDLVDPTHGATHYYAPEAATPEWASSEKMIPTVSIGGHRFFREVL